MLRSVGWSGAFSTRTAVQTPSETVLVVFEKNKLDSNADANDWCQSKLLIIFLRFIELFMPSGKIIEF